MENDSKIIKELIYNNVNVTETNFLKELFKILIQIILIAVILYFIVFTISGFVLKNLTIEKQVILENSISNISKVPKTLDLTEKEIARLNRTKSSILEYDVDFPKTSNLEINIMDEKIPNAFCLPNGNIYITSALYNKLHTDEQLTFVLAHEMAHYKNKDHLFTLRDQLSGIAILLALSLASPDATQFAEMIGNGLTLSDMNHSRKREAKADRYAGRILMVMYGSTEGGIEVLEFLSKNDLNISEFLSTHPDKKKRIKYLKSLNY